MKKTKEQQGITLVALIITIIVLLILAVVAIAAVSGDGIIQHAKDSTANYKVKQAEEAAQLILDEWKIVKHTPGANLLTFLQSKLGAENVTQNGEVYVVTIDGYEIIISNEQIMSKEEFENMPVTGELIAENTVKVGDLVYLIKDENNKTASVHGYRDVENMNYSMMGNLFTYNPTITSTELVIASKVEINGEVYTVTELGINMLGFNQDTLPIQKLTIPGTITSIGTSLFPCTESKKNTTLTDLIILEGNGNITISSSFEYCTALKNVTISSSVTNIANSFNNCTELENVTMQESTSFTESFRGSKWMLSLKDESGLVILNNVLIDGKQATGSVVIPSNVTSIDKNAFDGNTNITSVTMQNTITRIEDYAFRGCTGITDFIVPDTVVYIGTGAFYGCSKLTSINIPSGVSELSNSTLSEAGGVFANCTSLTNVNMTEGLTNIMGYTFYNCTSLKDIDIPDGITDIGGHAFRSCTSLKNIDIPSTVTFLGELCLANTGITNFTLNCNIISNGFWDGAAIFEENNTTLQTITISEGITSIPNQIFRDCKSITKIVIPNSVTYIGNNAFGGCTNLAEVTIPEGAIDMHCSAFNNTLWLQENNEATDGVSIIIDGTLFYAQCNPYTTYVVPSNITRIATGVFSEWEGVFITIPNTVEYIGGPLSSSWNMLRATVAWKEGKKPAGWADNWQENLVQITYAQ